MYSDIIDKLNDKSINNRLQAISDLSDLIKQGKINKPDISHDVNNHIHTIYSFSPYSPSKAVWTGYQAGLRTIGIMDHDSISGAQEFITAADILGIAATVGVETRVKMDTTALNGKRINNPDQKSIAYVAIHGIPHTQFEIVKNYFKPYTAKRVERDIKMTEKINQIFAPWNINLDFENDVKSLSMNCEGGSITERHILFALSLKLIQKFGKGQNIIDFLTDKLIINISPKIKDYLLDINNPYYEYDLLGVLKSNLVSSFYIEANDECPDIQEFAKLAQQTHSILAYAYLGDVTSSVTGDKKAQKFEDDYLDILFDTLKNTGFNAVTYMPSRNTLQQLREIRSRCEKYNLFQISGEDINTPRQNFICLAQRNAEFDNLYDAAWALIGHEYEATKNLNNSMFSSDTILKYPKISDRIKYYSNISQNLFK